MSYGVVGGAARRIRGSRVGAVVSRDGRRSYRLIASRGLPKAGRLPDGFYERPGVVRALGDGEFGLFFEQVRAATNWSQQDLGERVNLRQDEVARYEGGKPLQKLARVVDIAQGLGVPAHLLGFPLISQDLPHDEQQRDVAPELWSEHELARVVTATMIGETSSHLVLHDLLPDQHAMTSDAAGLVCGEDEFDADLIDHSFELRRGVVRGGASLAGLHAQLRWAVDCLEASAMSSSARRRSLLATADLAGAIAEVHDDRDEHLTARRLWLLGLRVARATSQPGLAARILGRMAGHCLELAKASEALSMVSLAQALLDVPHRRAAIDRRTTSDGQLCLAALLVCYQGWGHAHLGHPGDCHDALERAGALFTSARQHHDAGRWMRWFTRIELLSLQGRCLQTLARTQGGDARRDTAAQAVTLLRSALDERDPADVSATAVDLVSLATALFDAARPSAIAVGYHASRLLRAARSRRLYRGLGALEAASTGLAGPATDAFRQHLTATARRSRTA